MLFSGLFVNILLLSFRRSQFGLWQRRRYFRFYRSLTHNARQGVCHQSCRQQMFVSRQISPSDFRLFYFPLAARDCVRVYWALHNVRIPPIQQTRTKCSAYLPDSVSLFPFSLSRSRTTITFSAFACLAALPGRISPMERWPNGNQSLWLLIDFARLASLSRRGAPAAQRKLRSQRWQASIEHQPCLLALVIFSPLIFTR